MLALLNFQIVLLLHTFKYKYRFALLNFQIFHLASFIYKYIDISKKSKLFYFCILSIYKYRFALLNFQIYIHFAFCNIV